MAPKVLYIALVCLISALSTAQEYSFSSIPSELLVNANTVVRLDNKEVNIKRHNDLHIKRKKAITFLDETAHGPTYQIFHYYGIINVTALKATLFNAKGNIIKHLKANEFEKRIAFHNEKSGVKSGSYHVNLSELAYPFTLEVEYAYNSRTTAFIPSWMPLNQHKKSVEKSQIQIINNAQPKLQQLEKNLSNNKNIKVVKDDMYYEVNASHLKAIPKEDFQPALQSFTPQVNFSLEYFNLGKLSGRATSWFNLGQWKYLNTPTNTWVVNEASIKLIEGIFNNHKNKELSIEEKVEIIYNFVKDNHHLINRSIENLDWQKNEKLGPTHLAYDACLNTLVYTKNLLEVFGIQAFYALVNVNQQPVDIIEKLPSIQGNQMMLYLPLPDNELWLDCAYFEWPFNFISESKTQRAAFVITDNGGKIEFTPTFTSEENLQKTKLQFQLNEDGRILDGNLKRESDNIAFERRQILRNEVLLEADYMRQFSKLDNFKIENFKVSTPSKGAKKIEEFNFSGNLSKSIENSNSFSLSTFGTPFSLPKATTKRATPFTIAKGFSYEDEILIKLPSKTEIQVPFKKIKKNSKFGTYEVEVKKLANQLTIKRKYTLKSGEFTKADYVEFVKFMQRIYEDEQSYFLMNSSD